MHKLNVRLGDYNHGFTIRQTQDREELLEVVPLSHTKMSHKIVQNIGIGTKSKNGPEQCIDTIFTSVRNSTDANTGHRAGVHHEGVSSASF